ncbi:MAG: ATP:guanido phosphotransferase [Planctomycetota bacterium]|nr:MAG: ATP:guanido phosphotransferase [Planctomycetota bacterium]
MDLDALAPHCGEWLRGTGPESDIIMSSRIRLARNLADFPFPSKADETAKSEIVGLLRDRVATLPLPHRLEFLPVSEMDALDRQFLVERQLISREHSEAAGPRGVAVSGEESVSLMINEEDHLRLQVIHSGARSIASTTC